MYPSKPYPEFMLATEIYWKRIRSNGKNYLPHAAQPINPTLYATYINKLLNFTQILFYFTS